MKSETSLLCELPHPLPELFIGQGFKRIHIVYQYLRQNLSA